DLGIEVIREGVVEKDGSALLLLHAAAPALEGLAFPRRKRSPRVDTEIPLAEPAAQSAPIQSVDDTRHPAGPCRDAIDSPQNTHPERRTMPLPIARQKFALEPRDIHPHR